MVDCRTQDIAPTRLPSHFHLCFQAAIARWRYPLTGFLGDDVVAPFEEMPRYTSGRWMHYNVKECGHVPADGFSPLGQPLGSRARCLRIRMPHVTYCSKSIAASFGLSPFPLRNQRTPRCSRRQPRFSTPFVCKSPVAHSPALRPR